MVNANLMLSDCREQMADLESSHTDWKASAICAIEVGEAKLDEAEYKLAVVFADARAEQTASAALLANERATMGRNLENERATMERNLEREIVLMRVVAAKALAETELDLTAALDRLTLERGEHEQLLRERECDNVNANEAIACSCNTL